MSSPFDSGGSGAADSRPGPAAAGPRRRVLVSYESSARGRAALFHALGVAREAGVPLTVASVARKEPVVGCARCRSNAVMWNRELRFLAEEDLTEAAGLVGPSPAIDYEVALGDPPRALSEVAARSGADVIVVPSESHGRLRRLFGTTLAADLSRSGRWHVIVAPAATSRTGGDPEVALPAPAAGPEPA
jgi:nucleotide-binding universal stress UspA family protein